MNPLLYLGIGLGLAAIVATVYAVLSSEDGYEDEEGFHAVSPPRVKNISHAKAAAPDEEDSSIPPCVPAR